MKTEAEYRKQVRKDLLNLINEDKTSEAEIEATIDNMVKRAKEKGLISED